MNKLALVITSALAMLLLVSCRASSGGPAVPSGTDNGTGSEGSSAQIERGTTPEGSWYAQIPDSERLVITSRSMTYFSDSDSYVEESSYSTKREKDLLRLVPDVELFAFYEDMFYDRENDMLLCYTLSHMDGDGGHHLIEYKRTPYVAPPAPVYGPPVDLSDPDAKKDFSDLTIRSMEVSFHDAGMPYDSSSNMAPEAPYEDDYSYSLTVLDDGSARVSSSFCQEIMLSPETVDELQELAAYANLGLINGIDIHTPDLPYGSPEYDVEITLASGETISSSANGDNIPDSWTLFQEPMHHLLFWAFVDAGYNYGTGEFHSTQPMKRIGALEPLYRSETGFSAENVRITPDWKKAFDYSLDTQYFVFHDNEGKYPSLTKTLDELSRQYKKTAEEQLQKDYERMESVSKSVWKKIDRKYCYSLYAVDQWSLNGNIFHFMVSEGHANSLGLKESDYGQYRYIRYNIDVNTGKILSVSDLFTDTDAVYDRLMEVFDQYGTHNDSGKFVHSDAFPDFLRNALEHPEPEGIGFNITYHYLELWMPLGMYEGNDSQLREIIYYDTIQDILSDEYAPVQ